VGIWPEAGVAHRLRLGQTADDKKREKQRHMFGRGKTKRGVGLLKGREGGAMKTVCKLGAAGRNWQAAQIWKIAQFKGR